MANLLNDEEVLCSINSYKNIKNSSTMANVVTNLFTGGVAGRVTNDFKLVLTKENLYIQTIQYAAWGGLPEIVSTDKIPRDDIKYFEVSAEEFEENEESEESEKNEEFITITLKDNKTMNFIRDNEKNNSLALAMAMLISKHKEK